MQTYVKHFLGSERMYRAARAYRASIFEHHFDNAKNLTGVVHWLEDFLKKLNARLHQEEKGLKVDYVVLFVYCLNYVPLKLEYVVPVV
jgi:predicted ATP-binding protein involved in virulence